MYFCNSLPYVGRQLLLASIQISKQMQTKNVVCVLSNSKQVADLGLKPRSAGSKAKFLLFFNPATCKQHQQTCFNTRTELHDDFAFWYDCLGYVSNWRECPHLAFHYGELSREMHETPGWKRLKSKGMNNHFKDQWSQWVEVRGRGTQDDKTVALIVDEPGISWDIGLSSPITVALNYLICRMKGYGF